RLHVSLALLTDAPHVSTLFPYTTLFRSNTRHTIVTEYLFPDQRKETKRLDRRIKQVKRTFTKRDNPEGAAALRSLRAVRDEVAGDRKSTRLNSSHQIISYAVFCLKKKKK